jgi:FkbM family methyltransferase
MSESSSPSPPPLSLAGLVSALSREVQLLLTQPGYPSTTLFATFVVLLLTLSLTLSLVLTGGSGVGNRTSLAQRLFGCWVRGGRLRNLLCSPCDRARGRYPVANTCQIPFFKDLSSIYDFVFGYKTEGLFLEVGAYDGESFSNTSCLADMGWAGHYVEPIPQYAAACAARHAGNRLVRVHNTCVGEVDGVEVELSAAGPFSSAVEDEIAAVSGSKLQGALEALGWAHGSGSGAAAASSSSSGRVKSTTVSLNTFLREQRVPKGGAIDVMVVDTEGFEWPILKGFDLAAYRPKLVIVEIQELQARYAESARVQQDAASIFAKFKEAGYAILYKDVVNTVFMHKDVRCVRGD